MLDDESLRSAELWCAGERIDCLYLLAESSDARTVSLAAARHFAFVDIRIVLDRELDSPVSNPANLRLAVLDDIGALRRIARVSHYDSRFFFDGRFPQSRCEDLYATWIEQSVKGWASLVLVAEIEGKIAGYVTGHLAESMNGSIGLFAVDSNWRGQGIGRRLLAGVMHAFRQSGMQTASVVTQARNIGAQRLYQKAGFRTRSARLWFHRWFV